MADRRTALAASLARCFPAVQGSASLVLEVGCGHGHFLTAYATAHPERSCLGVDIASERITRAERKRVRAGLSNLHFLQADATLCLETLPEHVRVTDIFALFPDPWPKSRHHKHRLLQPAFLSALARRAASGARLYFRTDHRPYFADAEATVREHPDWALIEAPWPFEYETVFQTRAEEGYQSFIAQILPGSLDK